MLERASRPACSVSTQEARTIAQRGQMLVVFVLAIILIVGLVGLVLDVRWYWANSLRVQRAADAAALAAQSCPRSRPGLRPDRAGRRPRRTGMPRYLGGTSGPSTSVTGTVRPRTATNRTRMNVTISAPVGTFFMRLIGISSITATRTSKAQYALPVPMGRPETATACSAMPQRDEDQRTPAPMTDPHGRGQRVSRPRRQPCRSDRVERKPDQGERGLRNSLYAR